MQFDKNKNDIKNFSILLKEIKNKKNPYSKILIDSITNSSNPDECRTIVKEKVLIYIENKIKK
jgi:hypothetical protein